MSQSSEDTATSRFRAWWAGLLAAMSFALLCLLVSSIAGSYFDKPDLLMADVERAEARIANLEAIESEQVAAISQAAVVDDASNTIKLPVEKALPIVLPNLNKEVTKSKVPVPGALVEPAPAE